MKKNYEVHINKISNCWQYGIEIYAYSPKQQKCSKKTMWYNACNPACKEQYYDLGFIYDDIEAEDDAEWIEEEFINEYLQQYAAEYNLDLNTAKLYI